MESRHYIQKQFQELRVQKGFAFEEPAKNGYRSWHQRLQRHALLFPVSTEKRVSRRPSEGSSDHRAQVESRRGHNTTSTATCRTRERRIQPSRKHRGRIPRRFQSV